VALRTLSSVASGLPSRRLCGRRISSNLGLYNKHRDVSQSALSTFQRYRAASFNAGMATLEHLTTLSELSIPAGVEEALSVTSNLKPGSPASTTSSAGTKRKRATEPKFYAVRVGYHPGIYHSWAECLAEVTGFKNATCESDCHAYVRLALTRVFIYSQVIHISY